MDKIKTRKIVHPETLSVLVMRTNTKSNIIAIIKLIKVITIVFSPILMYKAYRLKQFHL